ncbi:eukaryotic translation initiation factor 3 subunit A-like [Penaeus chinensis]|uniref:eukaryotic translation initiation factor 3 subunit A-like n=1 Tax=Penaeus chinensis TaxID=139456 RepID=UPI001FB6C7AF|nr:eukaryotic translation initiation factor 3 subunit A-like [Penaeus chinensis]
MSDAAPQQPSAEGRRFSYVMGGQDPFDLADKGWLGVAEVTEDKPRPRQIPQVSARAEDETDEEEEQGKQKAWRKNEDIPKRFDELPTEEKWINVSDVIRRQREEQAQREAKQNKVRPPPDPEEERPKAPSDSNDDDAAKRGNREKKQENSAQLRERQESDDSEEDTPGVDAITESMLHFALKPGLMKDRGMGRRSSLPVTPTPAYGKFDRSSPLWTAAERPPRRSSFTEEEGERPPLRHRPREQHVRRGRSPRHSFSEDRGVERRPYREPSPDYELDESPPRSPYRQEYEPGRRGHRSPERHHEDDRRQRYPDDDWRYGHDHRPEDHDDEYPGRGHPRYDDYNYNLRPSGYDRGAYDDSPERYYEGDRRRDYFRQHSDPRHGRGSQTYSRPQYR